MIKRRQLSISRDLSNFLKFLSALLIAFHHYSQYAVNTPEEADNLFYRFASSQGGYLGVAVFFFLSGYGLMESELKSHLSIKQFCVKRIRRIVFPLIILAIIWIPISLFIQHRYLSVNPGFGEIALQTINIGGWFVSAILIMYVVFMAFSYVRSKYGETCALFWLCFLTVVVYIIVDRLLGYYTPLSIPVFTVGIIASLKKDANHGIFNSSIIYLLAGMIISVGYSISVRNSVALGAHSVINYMAMLALILVFTNFSPKLAFPAILGEASFDIYLIHKRIITSYSSIYSGGVIDVWFWMILCLILVSVFVWLRKKAYQRLFQR